MPSSASSPSDCESTSGSWYSLARNIYFGNIIQAVIYAHSQVSVYIHANIFVDRPVFLITFQLHCEHPVIKINFCATYFIRDFCSFVFLRLQSCAHASSYFIFHGHALGASCEFELETIQLLIINFNFPQLPAGKTCHLNGNIVIHSFSGLCQGNCASGIVEREKSAVRIGQRKLFRPQRKIPRHARPGVRQPRPPYVWNTE